MESKTRIKFYNRTSFITHVEQLSGYKIPYTSLIGWERTGKFVSSGYIQNGSRQVSVYTEKDVAKMVKLIETQKKKNSLRLRLH